MFLTSNKSIRRSPTQGSGVRWPRSSPPMQSSKLIAERLFEATARDGLPAVYPWREYVESGGLLSYGNDLTDAAPLVGPHMLGAS